MLTYELEQALADEGYDLVCGVDEAGRGPLCGPVAAAAVILPRGLVIEGLNDSKKLSEKKREALYDEICANAIAYSVVLGSVEEINETDILSTTLHAMREAIENLAPKPCEQRVARKLGWLRANRTKSIARGCVPDANASLRKFATHAYACCTRTC